MTETSDHPGRNAGPLLIILSGPSGVGKDAVLTRMKGSGSQLHYVVTVTTRPRRPSETDGVDYRFVTDAEFKQLLENDGFLECANVYGRRYGVPAGDVLRALESGQDTVVKIDVQGAETIKKKMPQAVAIFLAPPSMEELTARLSRRRTETAPDFEVRVKAATYEFERMRRFDYVVVNHSNEIGRAVADIQRIIMTERCRPLIDAPPPPACPSPSGRDPI